MDGTELLAEFPQRGAPRSVNQESLSDSLQGWINDYKVVIELAFKTSARQHEVINAAVSQPAPSQRRSMRLLGKSQWTIQSARARTHTHCLQLHLFIFNLIASLLGPDVSGPLAWRETIHTKVSMTLMTRRWWAIVSSAAAAFAAGHESASSIIKNHSLIFIHNCHERFQRHKDKQISAPPQSDRGPLSQQRRALRRTECFSLF